MPLPALALPAFVVMLLGTLGRVLTTTVGVVLFQLGIAAVTFTGFAVGLDALKDQVSTWLTGLPSQMIVVLSLMRIDQGIMILFSALTARVAMVAVQGALTRWSFSAPAGSGGG